MSIQTRRPQGAWTTVRPYTTYGNVISNYASTIQALMVNTKNLAIERKLLEYKNGNAAYSDVIATINDAMKDVLPGSQRELDLRETILEVENYETKKNTSIKRSQLEQKYARGGISAEERLSIEKELLQFFKEGTSDYSEQLSTIATATELARQEGNNVRLSQIQTQLSEGGLTTEEEIEYYEEGRDMSEPGTEERSIFERKINEAKARKEQEDITMEANEKYVELLDKYKEDGEVTNQDSLEIVRELLQIYKPGSDEYLQKKEEEVALLNAIADEGRSAGNKAKAAEEDAAEAQFWALEGRLTSEQKRFDIGAATLDEFLATQNEVVQEQNNLASTYPDIIDARLTGELQTRFQEIQALRNDIQTGNAVVVKLKSKQDGEEKQAIIPLSELAAYGQDFIINPATDESGRPLGEAEEGKVVTIIENGVEKAVLVTKGGKLEELETVGAGDKLSYKRTGTVLDYGSRTQSLVTKMEPAYGEEVLGANTSVGTTSSGGKVSTKKPTVSKSSISTAARGVAAAVSKGNLSKTSIATNIAKSAAKDLITKNTGITFNERGNVPYGKPTKGNIPGTTDYGRTEALSSGVKKLANKAKSILGNLFGRR